MKHITREKSQCDPHSSNNTDEEKKAILRKLNQLQRRAEEVVSSIRIVDATFQDMGFIIPSTVNFPQSSTAPSNGIRNTQMMSSSHELLSFRGRIKAEELFLFMDRDNDYLLNYEDFRGMECVLFVLLSSF